MSDILIKNVKMPKTCADCNFSTWNGFESVYCDVNAEFIPRKEWEEKRQDWCLLIEVSTPHGRLIDADALSERIEEQRNTEYAMKNRPVGTWKRVLELLLDMISDAPTIIEAEGET